MIDVGTPIRSSFILPATQPIIWSATNAAAESAFILPSQFLKRVSVSAEAASELTISLAKFASGMLYVSYCTSRTSSIVIFDFALRRSNIRRARHGGAARVDICVYLYDVPTIR